MHVEIKGKKQKLYSKTRKKVDFQSNNKQIIFLRKRNVINLTMAFDSRTIENSDDIYVANPINKF